VIDMVRAEKAHMVAAGVSLVVYAAVSWIAAKALGLSFWWAFGGLLLVRTFFELVDGLTGIINWRVFRRRKTIDQLLGTLRANSFPPRFYHHDQMLTYLGRIEDGGYPEPVRRAAQELETMLGLAEASGILAGARLHAAAEAALELYSPRAQAPVLGPSTTEP